jgi:predicted nucleic acid-binding Zn ribbon protein
MGYPSREKLDLLAELPVCWFCGEEAEPGNYSTCSEHCNTLLIYGTNEAWCDSVDADAMMAEREKRRAKL